MTGCSPVVRGLFKLGSDSQVSPLRVELCIVVMTVREEQSLGDGRTGYPHTCRKVVRLRILATSTSPPPPWGTHAIPVFIKVYLTGIGLSACVLASTLTHTQPREL
jgi:hypothetical protein